MDQVLQKGSVPSNQLKQLAGFGKGCEKNYDGTVTELQMQSYLIIRDFQRRWNKQGLEYGMPVSIFTTPKALWGYDHVTSAYQLAPDASRALIRQQIARFFPSPGNAAI